MKSVKKYSFQTLSDMMLGKSVHFTSDCEFFPNFNVKGKVLQMKMNGTEIVFKFKTQTGKTISIGSNMKNLQFEMITD